MGQTEDVLDTASPCTGAEEERLRGLLSEQIKFIEDKCYKAYGGMYGPGSADASAANRADSLFVEVVEHFSRDCFRVLREFRGRSSLGRFIETVISNKVIDIFIMSI